MGAPKNPKSGQSFTLPPEELVIVGLDTDDGLDHPLYDERIHVIHPVEAITDEDGQPVLNENGQPEIGPSSMTVAIAKFGVRVPVAVTAEQGEDGEWKYLVVDGRSRVRSLRHLNEQDGLIREIPVIVTELRGVSKTGALTRDLSIVLNEARTDDDPVTRAEKAARLYSQGVSKEDIAVTFSMSVPSLNRYLRFIEGSATTAAAGPKLKDAVRCGAIGWSEGWKLLGMQPDGSRLPDEDIEMIAIKAIKDGGYTPNRRGSGSSGPTNHGKPGRTGGATSGFVKHSTLKKWVERAPQAMKQVPAEVRLILDWFLDPAGTDLPEGHPLAVLMTAAEEEAGEKKSPGRKKDPEVQARKKAEAAEKAKKKAAKEKEKAAKAKAKAKADAEAAKAEPKAKAKAKTEPAPAKTKAEIKAEAAAKAKALLAPAPEEVEDEEDPMAAAFAALEADDDDSDDEDEWDDEDEDEWDDEDEDEDEDDEDEDEDEDEEDEEGDDD